MSGYRADSSIFVSAVDLYLTDVVGLEAELTKRYAELLPRIEQALAAP